MKGHIKIGKIAISVALLGWKNTEDFVKRLL
jgi:hypothetical protein